MNGSPALIDGAAIKTGLQEKEYGVGMGFMRCPEPNHCFANEAYVRNSAVIQFNLRHDIT
jgi:hypothetical protein